MLENNERANGAVQENIDHMITALNPIILYSQPRVENLLIQFYILMT